jgi:hypothetical protein
VLRASQDPDHYYLSIHYMHIPSRGMLNTYSPHT